MLNCTAITADKRNSVNVIRSVCAPPACQSVLSGISKEKNEEKAQEGIKSGKESNKRFVMEIICYVDMRET